MTEDTFKDRILSLIDDLTGGNKLKFAKMLGLSSPYLDRWTNQGSLPSAEHLANIQDKLHISIDWLLTGKGERYLQPAVEKVQAYYGGLYLPEITDEERQYIKRLIKIFHTKQDKTVMAIKQNIDAFLDTPNKSRVKKTASNE